MALIIEGIFISKTVTSLQIKVHECYIKKSKPRKSLLTIEEESEADKEIYSESSEGSDNEQNIEDLVILDEEVTE